MNAAALRSHRAPSSEVGAGASGREVPDTARPRIKRTTESFRSPEGDYYLRWPSAGQDIKIEQPDGGELGLIDALDGERTLAELHAEFGAEKVEDAHPTDRIRRRPVLGKLAHHPSDSSSRSTSPTSPS